MRNPLARLVHRDPAKPTLRERAASLKASLSRLGRRPAADADQGRRSMVAGSLVAFVPLPAMAVAGNGRVDHTHPDQAVFDAAAAVVEAERRYQNAREASYVAYDRAAQELGICPPAVLLKRDDAVKLCGPFVPRGLQRVRISRWARAHVNDGNHTGEAWTPAGLRAAIDNAVEVFGRAGTTPKRIRHYRELLPIVDAYDARRSEIWARHRVNDLSNAARNAGREMSAARDALDATRATTPAGLAVLARHLATYDCTRIEKGWMGLLHSAAAIGGVELHPPAEIRVRTTFM